uniref:Transmembrane protein 195 n=1 Tax=Neogobius melanostomus TaxID=47308 RepID=A0A8C6U458_9GOBI
MSSQQTYSAPSSRIGFKGKPKIVLMFFNSVLFSNAIVRESSSWYQESFLTSCPVSPKATPYFIGLMLLELVVGALKADTPILTIGDGLTSISCGMISRMPQLLFRGLELSTYMYVWENFRFVTLPWDSPWTWWACLLGVDFCYYWVHRFAHEVAFMWAAHQVHHSSEYYNLSTALRQSLTQPFTSWIFYIPLALAVPPSIFAVHIQLNLLYQFWIHTELIRDLGPLEWIFNTPKHHRVHHGRNEYCIDKNYGGILIIWDRLFGTFAEESEKVIYGLVFPIKTFEILYVQLHYYRYLWKKSKYYKKIKNKFLTFLNGPSWKPGKPRLGDHVDNPKVTGTELPHDPSWTLPLQLYAVLHFLLVLKAYHDLFEHKTVHFLRVLRLAPHHRDGSLSASPCWQLTAPTGRPSGIEDGSNAENEFPYRINKV